MRFLVLVTLALVVSGCASRSNQNAGNSISYKNLLANNNANIQRLSVGMTKVEVLDLMKSYTTETNDGVVLNPLKTKAMNADGQTYEVLYFVTDRHPPLQPIDESQATPVFLKDGRVVGWGQTSPRAQ
jgi:uncharacterized protein YceK